jgi:hypothetical protein
MEHNSHAQSSSSNDGDSPAGDCKAGQRSGPSHRAPRVGAQTSHRDAPVVCPVCERRVARRMRGQRFCSKRCRQKANYAEKVARGDFSTLTIARPTRPGKKQRSLNALEGGKTRSTARIIGPADVLTVEVFGGRSWQRQVSSDGIATEVARLGSGGSVEERHG